MNNEKTRRKKYEKFLVYKDAGFQIKKDKHGPRYITIKYDNGDKNPKTVQRKNRSYKE